MKPTITVGKSNQGFTIATTIIIPRSVRPICKQSIKADGSSSSIAPISLENLFKILPDGFVLKNRIVALVMLSNILSCNLLEALMQLLKKAKDLTREIMIVAIVIPEYI